MISEKLEIRPLLIPTAYPIRVGSGEWEVGSRTSVFYVLDNWPLPTPHSYRVGSGNEEWANIKVFTDHFSRFLFSTCEICPLLTSTAYAIRGFEMRSGK